MFYGDRVIGMRDGLAAKFQMGGVVKRLSAAQFARAIEGLEVAPRTLEIAQGVLVDGRPQAEYIKRLGVTKGAVSQAVSRVWDSHQSKSLPAGFERVTAVLPERQAVIVKKWEAAAKAKVKERAAGQEL